MLFNKKPLFYLWGSEWAWFVYIVFLCFLFNAFLKDYLKKLTLRMSVRDAMCRKTLGSICGIELNSINEYFHELDCDHL